MRFLHIFPICVVQPRIVVGLKLYVMFKTRAAVFYRDLKLRGTAEWLNTCCEFFERLQKNSWKSVCQESS